MKIEIESKFNLGDMVFTRERPTNRWREGEVRRISVGVTNEETYLVYDIEAPSIILHEVPQDSVLSKLEAIEIFNKEHQELKNKLFGETK